MCHHSQTDRSDRIRVVGDFSYLYLTHEPPPLSGPLATARSSYEVEHDTIRKERSAHMRCRLHAKQLADVAFSIHGIGGGCVAIHWDATAIDQKLLIVPHDVEAGVMANLGPLLENGVGLERAWTVRGYFVKDREGC